MPPVPVILFSLEFRMGVVAVGRRLQNAKLATGVP